MSVRYLNNHSAKFEPNCKTYQVLQAGVPNTVDFNVSYYEGSHQSKVWLVVSDDLKRMYQKYLNGGSVNLWCDAKCPEDKLIMPVKEGCRLASIEENEREFDDVNQ